MEKAWGQSVLIGISSFLGYMLIKFYREPLGISGTSPSFTYQAVWSNFPGSCSPPNCKDCKPHAVPTLASKPVCDQIGATVYSQPTNPMGGCLIPGSPGRVVWPCHNLGAKKIYSNDPPSN